MPIGFLGNVFGSAISAASNAANTKQINETNLKIAEMTNKSNRELVELQNKAAKEESELAYQRSKPTNQVANLRAAGMSRAGAINTLNGGGSYTPAPVNTSQDSAPQMQTADLTALANIGQGLENISQRKHEEKMQAMQLKAQKEENAANRQNAKDIAQIQAEASKYGADKGAETAANRLEFDKSVHEFFKDKRNELLEKEIQSYVDNHKASVQQREHFETIKPFLKDKADEEVKLIKQQIQRAKDQSDVEYKEYLLDKIRTSIYAKYGVRIDELRNSIDFWTRDRGTLSYTIGHPGNNKKLRELENVEKDFLNYLNEIDKMLEELD